MDRQPQVAVSRWAQQDALSDLVAEAFTSLASDVCTFLPSDPLPEHADLVLVFGPFGSLVPITNQLLDIPPGRRPKFGLWMTEGLPRPDFPEWLRQFLSRNRSWVERQSSRKNQAGLYLPRPGWQKFLQNGFRYRYYGDLVWLQKKGLLNVLATGSKWIGSFLRARGFDPVVAYYGLQPGPEWGENLDLNRDIPVLWLGKIASSRRKDLLSSIRERLEGQNVSLKVIDGVENPGVHGRERTILLNRTKIVLNLLRQPWDNNSVRFFLAALNKALVISEPTYPHLPLESQVHYIETDPARIVPQILHYLNHEAEREQLAENAHLFVKNELNIVNGAAQILQKIKTTG